MFSGVQTAKLCNFFHAGCTYGRSHKQQEAIMVTQGLSLISSDLNEEISNGNDIISTHYDVSSEVEGSPSSHTNIDEDSPVEIKAVEVPKQRKKKRTQKELAELNAKICVLYGDGYSESAISIMLNVGADYVAKAILRALRAKTLEVTPTIYEIVTGGISVCKLIEIFGLPDSDTKPLFQAEVVGDTIVLKPFNHANAEGNYHV